MSLEYEENQFEFIILKNYMRFSLMALVLILAFSFTSFAQVEEARKVIPSKKGAKLVTIDVMNEIYEKVKTPYKYGIVLKVEEKMVDSPSIFYFDSKWYMIYITYDGSGYETSIAQSDDLLNWKCLGKILEFTESTWDANQAAGYIALQNYEWLGSYELNKYDNKFWLSYLGGNTKGYEAGKLGIGIAWSTEPTSVKPWIRLKNNPVLTSAQPDTRKFENDKLFKSHIIWDKSNSLGFPFIMFYNAKEDYETIGMAVSNDMISWQRYGLEPVIDNGEGISGDPQIVKIDDVWVMFYFGAFWKPNAFETFACSYDLVHWNKWKGPNLIEPSEPWDSTYAHKPWVVVKDNVVYHFYCAVGNEGRVIALATSVDLKMKNKQ